MTLAKITRQLPASAIFFAALALDIIAKAAANKSLARIHKPGFQRNAKPGALGPAMNERYLLYQLGVLHRSIRYYQQFGLSPEENDQLLQATQNLTSGL